MKAGLRRWLFGRIVTWLIREKEATGPPICDFDQLATEIRPCDVLLVEGRSRVSDVIKAITQSPWTHSALYLGRLREIPDPDLRERIREHYDGDDDDQLVLEALLGHGTIVNPLDKYRQDNLRICRPTGLSRSDIWRVIDFATHHLGCRYDVRQLLDLARFLFPWGILPRRWRSSLFEHNAGGPTRTVCSSLIAAAFSSVHFPILPLVRHDENGAVRLYKRNSRLYTPRDFDYSPYFEIIKHPYYGFQEVAIYRQLPWDREGAIYNDEELELPAAGDYIQDMEETPDPPPLAPEGGNPITR
ncbi:MAG TPA: hypothetical protein ENK54_05575 [Thiotrichales bacterium]|nr:hypothetical protein [Thiotrichales bacterium]